VAPLLGLLTLPDADGEPAPAHGIVLPGSPAAALLDPRVLAPVHPATAARWGTDVLVAVGVRADLLVVTVPEVLTGEVDDAADGSAAALLAADLDGWDDYVDHLADLLGPG